MQHLRELWIRVQTWADLLISVGLFDTKHPGSRQESCWAWKCSDLVVWTLPMDSSASEGTLTSWGPVWTWGCPGMCWLTTVGTCEEIPREECSRFLREGRLLLSNTQNPFSLNFERLGQQEAVAFVYEPHALSLMLLLSVLPCHAGDAFSSCILCLSVPFDLAVCLLEVCMFTQEQQVKPFCLLYLLLFWVMACAVFRLEVALVSVIHSHRRAFFLTTPRKSGNSFHKPFNLTHNIKDQRINIDSYIEI